MAIINRLSNTATVIYNDEIVTSAPAITDLLVLPTIVKVVDKLTAKLGEILTYTVTIANLGLVEMTNIPFHDILPPGTEYVDGSFTLNGTAVTPTIVGSTLSFAIPSIAPLGTAVISFQVEVVGGEI